MKLFILLFPIVLLSSCSIRFNTCQTFKIASSNVKQVDSAGISRYRYEDSLVIIDYNLWSSGGTVKFNIYNKSDEPIYVNWKNSNFIFQGYNNEYYSNETISERKSTTNASATSNTSGRSSYNIYNVNPVVTVNKNYKTISDFSSITDEVTIVQKESQSIQIPPKSFNTYNKFNLNVPFFQFKDSLIFVAYDKTNSPLLFRNYLAISKDKDFRKQLFIDNDFWISEVTTNITKGDFSCFDSNSGKPSCFYLYKTHYEEDKKMNRSLMHTCLFSCLGTVALAATYVFLVIKPFN